MTPNDAAARPWEDEALAIAEFLTARYDVLEALVSQPDVSRLVAPGERRDGVAVELAPYAVLDDDLHASVTYVLDDIATKREIVAWAVEWLRRDCAPWNVHLLRTLASLHAEHDDYQPEWTP